MGFVESSTFWIDLLKIIWVNILLSSDNAVVIALASRSLPPSKQKHAVIWGSVAAIISRVILTIFAVQLLQLPWLKAAGAVMLMWIGVQLLDDEGDECHVKEAGNLFYQFRLPEKGHLLQQSLPSEILPHPALKT